MHRKNKKPLLGLLLVLALVFGGIYLYKASNLTGTTLQGAFRPCTAGSCIMISTSGPSAGTYSAGQSDFELFDLTFENKSSSSSIDINQLVFNLNSTGGGLLNTTDANYSDIKLVDVTSGAVIAGPVSLSTTGSDSAQTITFTNKFNIASRSSISLKLMMDVASGGTVTTGDTLSANLRVQNLIATWTSRIPFVVTGQVSPQTGVPSKIQTAL